MSNKSITFPRSESIAFRAIIGERELAMKQAQAIVDAANNKFNQESLEILREFHNLTEIPVGSRFINDKDGVPIGLEWDVKPTENKS